MIVRPDGSATMSGAVFNRLQSRRRMAKEEVNHGKARNTKA